MDEYIKREDALDAVLFALSGTGYQSRAICAIRGVPTTDVVDVVRCKDCVHASFLYSCGKYMCKKGCGATKTDNDFCSYGAKMKGGEE